MQYLQRESLKDTYLYLKSLSTMRCLDDSAQILPPFLDPS